MSETCGLIILKIIWEQQKRNEIKILSKRLREQIEKMHIVIVYYCEWPVNGEN
jgi:hypothetical protein